MGVSKRYGLVLDQPPANATITHGSQITTANTGYTAYVDSGLGRKLVLGDLTVVSGAVRPSDFVAPGGTITKKWFQSDVRIDQSVTFVGCKFGSFVSSYLNGTEYGPSQFNWCSFDPDSGTVTDVAVGANGTSLYRCFVRGGSDAGWINGGPWGTQSIVESYLRVWMASAVDHNDGLQCSGGAGTVVVQRCNIDVTPENGLINGGTQGGPNSCIMSADLTSSTAYNLTVDDCLLTGGTSASIIRFYDGALSANIIYSASGNLFTRGSSNPVDRGGSNTTPTGQVTWSNNRWADDLSTIPLG